MSTSAVTLDRWDRILIQRKDWFSAFGFGALSLVASQESFRTHFETECWRLNEPRPQTLLGRIDCSFYHIESFIQAVNTATLCHGSSAYVNLIWGACFAIIECVARNGPPQRPIDLRLNGKDGPVQLVADLNNSIPNFESDLRYAGEASVQDALQGIFETYIDCCLSIVTLYSGKSFLTPISNIPIANSPRDCLLYAAEKFSSAKAQFEKAVSLINVTGPPKLGPPRRRDSPTRYSIPGEWPSINGRQGKLPSLFQIDKVLGFGASGHVEKVTRISDGKSFARKQMERPLHISWSRFRYGVLEEIIIMQKVQSMHVVTVEFYLEEPESYMEIFMTPVADGNLGQILRNCIKSNYPEVKTRQIYSWFGCLLSTLAYVHREQVVHKDIKPQNILAKDGKIYLADFGLSRDFMGGLSQTMSPFAGTEEYQAPEFENCSPHGRASDVFSLGCVFSEMLSVVRKKDLDAFKSLRVAPVKKELIDYDKNSKSLRYSFHKSLPQVKSWVRKLDGDATNSLLVSVILRMLEYDATKRITAEDALEMLGGRNELRCKCIE